jgi:thymidine kinase
MFAGKTTELMRRVKREIHARLSCFVIKYCRDTRYNKDHVSSHDKMTLRAKAAVAALAEVGEEWRHHDVIAVDEGQFFPDLVDFCRLVSDAGKTVFVSALDGDFMRKPFGRVCELIPLCESVTKLTAVCMMCHQKEASFTRRTVSSSQQELIGGADMYIAACRECFLNPAPPSPRRMGQVQQAIKDVEIVTMGPMLKLSRSEENSPANRTSGETRIPAATPSPRPKGKRAREVEEEEERATNTVEAALV